MCDLTYFAFDIADKYRNPVFVLTDGVIGQMMEAVDIPEPKVGLPDKSDWAVEGTAETRHLINSIYLDHNDLENWNLHLLEKYNAVQENEVMIEEYLMDDAEIAVIGYGCVSRVLRTVVDAARSNGIKLGLFRPITLFPFPKKEINALPGRGIRGILTVEMSTGQMVDDVNLSLGGKMNSDLYFRVGGNVPSAEEILARISELYGV